MKLHEPEIRTERAFGPFTIVTTSGDRIKVRSAEHLFLPPLEDEDGRPVDDIHRSDFFEVWSDGRRFRRIAFSSVNIIETQDRERNE